MGKRTRRSLNLGFKCFFLGGIDGLPPRRLAAIKVGDDFFRITILGSKLFGSWTRPQVLSACYVPTDRDWGLPGVFGGDAGAPDEVGTFIDQVERKFHAVSVMVADGTCDTVADVRVAFREWGHARLMTDIIRSAMGVDAI